MKPILLVIACIVLLILVIYHNRDSQYYKTNGQTESPNAKIMKDSYEFLPNEARMCDLVY